MNPIETVTGEANSDKKFTGTFLLLLIPYLLPQSTNQRVVKVHQSKISVT